MSAPDQELWPPCVRCLRDMEPVYPDLGPCEACLAALSALLDEDEGVEPDYDFSDGPVFSLDEPP